MSNNNNEANTQRIERIKRRKANTVKKLATILFVKIDEHRQMTVSDIDVNDLDSLTTELENTVAEYKDYNDDLYELIDLTEV